MISQYAEDVAERVGIHPVNWEQVAKLYIKAGDTESANYILQTVGIAAEEAINKINTLAMDNEDIYGIWL